MRGGITRFFLYSSGLILLITSVAKFISVFGHSHILNQTDPVFMIKWRQLLLVVGVIEALIAVFCFFGKNIIRQVGFVAWIATSFLLYRLMLVWIGYLQPCRCMGSIGDNLHISPDISDLIMRFVLAYLLVGSYVIILFWIFRQKRTNTIGVN